MAGARGMRPVFDSADVLLGEHAAYWIENGNTLRFAIPVPIIPIEAKLLTAYRLESGNGFIRICCSGTVKCFTCGFTTLFSLR